MYKYLFNTYLEVLPLGDQWFDGEIPGDPFRDEGLFNPLDPKEWTENPLIKDILKTGEGLAKKQSRSFNNGVDFLQYIFNLNGVDIPDNLEDILNSGTEVTLSEVKPGDIIYTRSKSKRSVLIVSDVLDGNIRVLDGNQNGVTIRNADPSEILTIRRLMNSNPKDPFLSDLDILAPASTPSSVVRTNPAPVARVQPVSYKGPIDRTLISIDIEDLLRQEGITSVNGKRIKFGDKNLRSKNAKFGVANSHHKEKDPHTGNANARDISIVGGTDKDYADFRRILLNNERVRTWFQLKGWGIINELTAEVMSRTNATGRHFHFGPDKWALRTWSAWLKDPNVSITQVF